MGRTTSHISQPGFVVDNNAMRKNSGRQIDWAHVGEQYRSTPGLAAFTVKVDDADVNAGETSFGVDALEGPIPTGTVLEFSDGSFAKLSAAADAGDTTLTVVALTHDIANDATANFAGTAGSGPKVLKAGTAIGELLGSGMISPRVASTNPATGLLVSTAIEDDPSAALSGHGVYIGGVVYEDLLPDAVDGDLADAIKTELETAGCTFQYEAYSDDRAS